VMEHVHPSINGWKNEQRTGSMVLLTADYRGVAVDPVSHNVFFGGMVRSTLFTFGTHNPTLSSPAAGYWGGQVDTEGKLEFQWDLWPDAVAANPTPSERKDDNVFGAATSGDGTFWIGSGAWGLVHVSSTGAPLGYLSTELISPQVSGVAVDPTDGSVWAGARWGGGVSRVQAGQVVKYGLAVFGPAIANLPVTDVQTTGTGTARQVLVTFDGTPSAPGALGIYTGP
jgi:hypothetical protein